MDKVPTKGRTSSGRTQLLQGSKCLCGYLTPGRIQCRQILQRKHNVPSAICEVCGEHDETPEHIVNGCTLARQYWIKIGVSCHRDFQCGSSIDLNALIACRNRSLGCSLPHHVGSSGKREMHRSTADHLMQDGGGKMGS